jgi:uncharacterized protein with HEPN domain
MEIDQLGRLRDILDAARLIATYVQNTTETDFYADKQKQDAVIRRIEIIGEAAAHVTAVSRQAVPELAFRKMRGMRNIVAPRLCQRGFEDRLGSRDRVQSELPEIGSQGVVSEILSGERELTFDRSAGLSNNCSLRLDRDHKSNLGLSYARREKSE